MLLYKEKIVNIVGIPNILQYLFSKTTTGS